MSFTPPIASAKHIVRKVIHGPKLPLALTGAIAVSFVLAGLSVTWYYLDGSSKLDLSRPGYEAERTEVLSNATPKTYDTTSPVTKDAINSFLSEYDNRTRELAGYGNFADNALDDNGIQLNVQSGSGSSVQ